MPKQPRMGVHARWLLLTTVSLLRLLLAIALLRLLLAVSLLRLTAVALLLLRVARRWTLRGHVLTRLGAAPGEGQGRMRSRAGSD